MATKRQRRRSDGTTYWQVRFRLDGIETSESLKTERDAEAFRELVDRIGGARAREIHGLESVHRSGTTVGKWMLHYINHRTGVARRTKLEDLGILKNDIDPALGPIPLSALTRDDIARWVESMAEAGAAGKTIANKHGLLSGGLNAAVEAKHIRANPAAGIRLPRTERREMRILSREEFAKLLAEIPEYWRPLVRFLVASGARPNEALALYPSDVNRAANTVRISRAWRRGGGYHMGPTKTAESVRTIDVPKSVLDQLEYSHEYLFTNSGRGRRNVGGPVRLVNFRANVWNPAVARAKIAAPLPWVYDLRHTYASWMIEEGVPLPVVQEQLGHDSIETTRRHYVHLDRRSGQAAADIMAGLLGGAGG